MSHLLGGILSLCETLEGLRGSENVTKTSLDIMVVSRKWMKVEFCGELSL